MIQLSSPTRVTPASSAVPRLMVTYSRSVLLSPISTAVSSPAYFLSWGGAPIGAKWKILLLRRQRGGPGDRRSRSGGPPRSYRLDGLLGAEDRRLGDDVAVDARDAIELGDGAQAPLAIHTHLQPVFP